MAAAADDVQAFWHGVALGDEKTVKRCVRRGVPVNQPLPVSGVRAVHVAVANSRSDMLHLLRDLDADLSCTIPVDSLWQQDGDGDWLPAEIPRRRLWLLWIRVGVLCMMHLPFLLAGLLGMAILLLPLHLFFRDGLFGPMNPLALPTFLVLLWHYHRGRSLLPALRFLWRCMLQPVRQLRSSTIWLPPNANLLEVSDVFETDYRLLLTLLCEVRATAQQQERHRNSDRETAALLYSVWSGDINCVKHYLSKGGFPDRVLGGICATHVAVINDQDEMLALLRTFGADMRRLTSGTSTWLQMADGRWALSMFVRHSYMTTLSFVIPALRSAGLTAVLAWPVVIGILTFTPWTAIWLQLVLPIVTFDLLQVCASAAWLCHLPPRLLLVCASIGLLYVRLHRRWLPRLYGMWTTTLRSYHPMLSSRTAFALTGVLLLLSHEVTCIVVLGALAVTLQLLWTVWYLPFQRFWLELQRGRRTLPGQVSPLWIARTFKSAACALDLQQYAQEADNVDAALGEDEQGGANQDSDHAPSDHGSAANASDSDDSWQLSASDHSNNSSDVDEGESDRDSSNEDGSSDDSAISAEEASELFNDLSKPLAEAPRSVVVSRSELNRMPRLRTRHAYVPPAANTGKQRELERKFFCVICQSADKCVELLPCNHICFCVPCSQQFQKSAPAGSRLFGGAASSAATQRCPICRSAVLGMRRVFLS